ncbi:hypothetical protein L6452_25372 [Arctium lappa]|uniref:Uncharacterized protein n=1 Tax=Arctium lappa TaxID=4217 RepID=A0ACB9ABA5_ARCLA|nr:hypothetical protein L6452_25372 [Arctium lappa]
MDFLNIDARYLLLPLAHFFFQFPHFTSTILTIFLLFVSIKVVIRLQLPIGFLLRFQAIDLSVSVMACFLCLISLSTQHFWIVNPILILLSHWVDDWLHQTLKSIPVLEFLCVFNCRHEEEEETQQEELNWEPDDHFVVVNVDDELEDD